MPRPSQIPTYRLHKPSGRAVVTLNGKDQYLGEHSTAESRTEYQRLIAEWLVQQKTSPAACADDGLFIAEVILAYVEYAQTYYQDAEGIPTNEIRNVKTALRPLEMLYGRTAAKDFGPLALKAIRQSMIGENLCRGVINQRISIIKRVFKWASSEELIPAGVFHGLMCVEGLRRGRSKAKETAPIKPVLDAYVDAVLPFLSPTVRAMVQIQRATGMRTGELVIMRRMDLDPNGSVWFYKPRKHKTEHHGHGKLIVLGPKAQKAIKSFLTETPTAYLFSPAQAKEEWYVAKRKCRKTKVQPSQLNRRKKQPKRAPGDHYDTHGYYRAVQHGIKKARKNGIEIPHWHPHQLRHSAATRIRKEHGLDAARAVLGHRSLAMTETYAEIDAALASQVAAALG